MPGAYNSRLKGLATPKIKPRMACRRALNGRLIVDLIVMIGATTAMEGHVENLTIPAPPTRIGT
jgi:hypothetical protein